MIDVTKASWWKWETGMTVFIQNGYRPVDKAIVIAAGDSYRVADQWGDLGALSDPRTGKVTLDLTAPANIGILFDRLTQELWRQKPSATASLVLSDNFYRATILTINFEDGSFLNFHNEDDLLQTSNQDCRPIIAALDLLIGETK